MIFLTRIHKILLKNVRSETERIIYQNYIYTILVMRIPGDEKLAADSIRLLAVEAFPVFFAWSIYGKTHCI